MVKKKDFLIDNRLSQAGLNFQSKLIEFIKPEYNVALVPIFFKKKYTKKSKVECFVNTIQITGRFKIFRKILRVIFDCLFAFILILRKDNSDVLIYNVDPHNILLCYLLRYFSNKKIFVISADYITFESKFKSIVFNKVLRDVDGVIKLSPNIDCNSNSQLLLGLVREKQIAPLKHEPLNNNCLFSGSLGKTTGFELILDCFNQRSEHILHVTGIPFRYSESDFSTLLKSKVEKSEITYHGLLNSDEYMDILGKCDIAFSLRDPNDIEHEFNFPSKILEYLASGKFVISSMRYDGIPEGILFYCDFSIKSLNETIDLIYSLSMKDVQKKRKNIHEYIINNFTESAILNCIEKLRQDHE